MTTFLDKRIINLYSANGTLFNGNLNSRVQFQFTDMLHDKDLAFAEIGVINAEIPVSFYVINEYNNTLTVEYQLPLEPLTTTTTLTMTKGNYTATNFITTFLTLLEQVTSITTPIETAVFITLDRNTGRLLISIDATFLASLAFRGGSMFSIMGFVADFVVSGTATSPPNPINLLGINKISIKSDRIATYNYDSAVQGFSNTLTTIEVDSPPYGIILYKNTSLVYNILRVRDLDIFTIELTDEKGNPIDFNGQEWSITLGLNLHRFTPTNTNKTFRDILTQPNKETNESKESKESEKPKKEKKKDNDLELLMR